MRCWRSALNKLDAGHRNERQSPGPLSRTHRPTRLLAILCLWAGFLASPALAGAYDFYYANLHSHCALSDGIGTPEEAYTHARDVADIDVLALTDHTHLLSATEYSLLLSIADQYTQDGVFVALGAQEFGNLNDFGHINIFDSAFRNPNPTENLTATYNFILTQGAFGSFNHPNPSYGSNFEDLAFNPQYEDAMRAIEVVNGRASLDYEVQLIQALNNGWRIGPFANQDNHQGNWGDQGNPNMGGRIYLTGILAETLTKQSILDALSARRFYAMEVDPPSDRIELEFYVDGIIMGTEVETGVSPIFTAHARAVNGISLFNRVDLFRDGVIVDSQVLIGEQIDYQFQDFLEDGESHYYFVRVRQVDSDRAWSAPVWVTANLDPAEASGGGTAPSGLALLPNAPNPFSPRTDIRFVLPARSGTDPYRIRLTIHETGGRLVRDLGERLLSAGEHRWAWDGRDGSGRPLNSGIFLFRLAGQGLPTLTSRVVLLQ